MGQLYASLKTGHVTASVVLKRLLGFSAKNRFYRANRDFGRCVCCSLVFPSVLSLGSTSSAPSRPGLFAGFIATTKRSDFSCPCFIGFYSSSSRRGPLHSI